MVLPACPGLADRHGAGCGDGRLIAAVRWIVLPRVKPGVYSVHSWFYVRKWMVALATEVTLETLSSLYATVYMRGWYRLMGAKIGKDAEISTNLSGRYDLVEIGEKCFIADEVVLGDEDIRRGWMNLAPVQDRGARVRRQRRRGAARLRSSRTAPDRHQVEAPGQRHDVGGRYLVRLARRSSCRSASSIDGVQRQLDLRAAALRQRSVARCSRPCTSRCRRCCSSPSARWRWKCSAPATGRGPLRRVRPAVPGRRHRHLASS